ncbi:MAG TPA: class I SAM-dependent methyltransferase [Leptospiraceae bacterium]|jgi:SAM-dependent methyltransferase|nr:class I SAM-dependent methyltransferase [Leptospirales bacterium]HMU84594.1 class I SAM-dependent methyltransferase [Leptospiraceae bacterium]HMW62191.1 class I SAM-dependent methyltransferase [Leptospiraceae bacterium]HMX57852.1 class I SAM-dependent methyltransferase [Leptospiraceae bacterium]HMZ35573.1 class I SAM-dependent methyltransferase [Leptospiraceae bacterium]
MQVENNPADKHIARAKEKPLGWFEDLYRDAARNADLIPWADDEANPNLRSWAKTASGQEVLGSAKTALVVGCGLGDDAEFISRFVPEVTAFDISETAIAWAKERFANTKVKYMTANLFELATSCDFVFESYTIQALPLDMRSRAVARLPEFMNPGGRLLLVARGRENEQPLADHPPWPLSRADLSPLDAVLQTETFEDYVEGTDPGIRRFRILYKKP